MAVTASFSAQSGTLTVFGDNLGNDIVVSRNAAGQILINGGAVAVVEDSAIKPELGRDTFPAATTHRVERRNTMKTAVEIRICAGNPKPITGKTIWNWLCAQITRIRSAYAARREARQAALALAAMSDRELHDIGLTRSEIERTARWPAAFSVHESGIVDSWRQRSGAGR